MCICVYVKAIELTWKSNKRKKKKQHSQNSKHKTIKLKHLREICIAIQNDQQNKHISQNTYATTFSISENYLFGLKCVCFDIVVLVVAQYTVQYECTFSRCSNNSSEKVWSGKLPLYRRDTQTNWLRLHFASVFVRICGWVRFSNYSSRSLLLLNFYLFHFFFTLRCVSLIDARCFVCFCLA